MTSHHIIVDCIYQENNAVLGMVSMCLAQVNIELFFVDKKWFTFTETRVKASLG